MNNVDKAVKHRTENKWHRLPAFLYPTSFGPPRARLECRKVKEKMSRRR